jgi:hypothetical protein
VYKSGALGALRYGLEARIKIKYLFVVHERIGMNFF